MTLTKDELTELTKLINARRDELERGLSRLSAGEVRMAHDVFMEWVEGQAATTPNGDRQESIDSYALTDAYHFGYERGKEATRRELGVDNVGDSGPRLVTNSAPEPDERDDDDEESAGILDMEEMFDERASVEMAQAAERSRRVREDLDLSAAEAPPKDDEKLTSEWPIGPKRGALPDPAQARENVAAMLAQANGDHGFDLTPGYKRKVGRPAGHKGGGLPTMDEVVAFLQEIAMAGVMPSQSAFNAAKPSHWATATAHCMRLDMSWSELAAQAGLAPNPRERTV